MKEKIVALYEDSLFRNSFYLMLSTAIMAALGFIFWVVCSHLYTPSDVGLATSLISAAGLMSTVGILGFNNVLIRFLAGTEKKDEHISTAFILASLGSLLASAGFLVWAFSTHSPIIQSSHVIAIIIIFTAYVVGSTVNVLLESAFIAYRATNYIVFKNIILSGSKLLLIFFVVSIGFLGILGATTLGIVIACVIGYLWLVKKFSHQMVWKVDKVVVNETKRFAFGNYVGNLFGVLPSTVLTLIVLSRLGAQEAAFFYMPTMIVALLNVIPSSTAQSLFAEVSHDEGAFAKHFKNALKHLFSFLVPGVIATELLGKFILHFFGSNYAAYGTAPLQILALSSLIGAANYLGDTLLNIRKQAGMYIFMNAINALGVVILAYVFAPYGLAAVAWSVLWAQVAVAIIYVFMNWKILAELRTVPA
jgi:O-antigen/teichoic acid export membrane protein